MLVRERLVQVGYISWTPTIEYQYYAFIMSSFISIKAIIAF